MMKKPEYEYCYFHKLVNPYRAVDLMWSWFINPTQKESYEANIKKIKKLLYRKSDAKKQELLDYLTDTSNGKAQTQSK